MSHYLIQVLITGFFVIQRTRATFMCPTLFDFYPDPEDCTKFYRCFWGAAYPFHCPTGTKWNHKLLTCDFSHNVDCDGGSHMGDQHGPTNEEVTIPTKDLEYDYKTDEGDYKTDDTDYTTDESDYTTNDTDYTTDDTDYTTDESDYTADESDYTTDESYDSGGSLEAGNYDIYDIENESGSKGDQNLPTHGRRPIVPQPEQETVTPSNTPPSSLEPTSTVKSLVDYLYPDYHGGEGQPDDVERGRSDVTHDYAWYEGRDYSQDYEMDRHVDQHYTDYVYDYRTERDEEDYDFPTDTNVNEQKAKDDEFSYFQNGYPGFRHHYEHGDFLSPAYARHNGPIGRRR